MASGQNVAELSHLNPIEDLPDDHFLAVIYGVRRSGKTNSADATGSGGAGGEDDVPDILVIMDDVCSEESIRHSRAMGTVAMNGRQYRMSVIILSQMVAGSGSIPPRVRTQVKGLALR